MNNGKGNANPNAGKDAHRRLEEGKVFLQMATLPMATGPACSISGFNDTNVTGLANSKDKVGRNTGNKAASAGNRNTGPRPTALHRKPPATHGRPSPEPRDLPRHHAQGVAPQPSSP